MTKDEIIALAAKHCYCSSNDHKEFLHEDLIAFAEQLLAAGCDRDILTDDQIASACISYRHDFGLLSRQEQESMVFQAREWERALRRSRDLC